MPAPPANRVVVGVGGARTLISSRGVARVSIKIRSIKRATRGSAWPFLRFKRQAISRPKVFEPLTF